MTKSNVPTDWNAIVVTIPRALERGDDLKDAASFCWKISDEEFLNNNHLVLAQSGGSIIGVYQMKGWYKVEDMNIGPHFKRSQDWTGRIGFFLVDAPNFLQSQYLGKKVSSSLQGVKFIRSTQNHLHTQDFAPQWWERYCAQNESYAHNERMNRIYDEVRKEEELEQGLNQDEFDKIVDDILASKN